MPPRCAAFVLLGASMLGGLGCAVERPALATPTDAAEIPSDAAGRAAGRIAITEEYACEVDDAGAVDCWGDLRRLWPELFGDVPAVRSIGASELQICMLTLDGEVWCRRIGRQDPAQKIPGIKDAIAIGVGIGEVCAVVRDGHVHCRRGSSNRAQRVLGVSDAVSVSVGQHACARTSKGSVFCWDRSRHARRLPGFADVVDLEIAGDQTWIVESTGRVGRRWDGRTQWVSGLDDAVELAADEDVACARRSSGAVSCWEAHSQLEDAIDVATVDEATALAFGFGRGCVRERDGATRCWGDNREFELGDAGGLLWWDEPQRVDGLPPIKEVHTGPSRVCAVSETNELWCWGEAREYELPGPSLRGSGPHPIGGGVIHVLLERNLNCAQDSHAQLSCWGTVDRSDVVNIEVATANPIVLPEGTVAAELHDGELCAYGGFGLRCGSVWAGGVIEWSSELLSLPASRSVSSLALGEMHGCVVLDDNTTWCWGFIGGRELEIPTAIAGLPSLTTVASGDDHTCGLDQAGRAWCWGRQPGAEEDDPVTPIEIEIGPPLRSLAAGWHHTCGLTETGEVWCWDAAGAPARVGEIGGFAGIVQLDTRDSTTCGVDDAGAVWCWGSNAWRQVNPASPWVSYTPLTVAPERRVRIVNSDSATR